MTQRLTAARRNGFASFCDDNCHRFYCFRSRYYFIDQLLASKMAYLDNRHHRLNRFHHVALSPRLVIHHKEPVSFFNILAALGTTLKQFNARLLQHFPSQHNTIIKLVLSSAFAELYTTVFTLLDFQPRKLLTQSSSNQVTCKEHQSLQNF